MWRRATGASSAASCCCSRLLVEALPGARRWCATEAAAGARPARKKTPRDRGVSIKSRRIVYLDTDRLNIRSIFSFVASHHDWLAWAAATAWLAVLWAPLAAWLAALAALFA